MGTRRWEQEWEERVDRCIALGNEWLRHLDHSPALRHDLWVQFRMLFDTMTPRRKRQVMEGLYLQLEFQWADDAADEIVFGGQPDPEAAVLWCASCGGAVRDEPLIHCETDSVHRPSLW